MAKELDSKFLIIDVRAEPDELLRRLERRKHDARDASEADVHVLRYQYERADPLDAEELEWTIAVATDADVDADIDADVLAEQIRQGIQHSGTP